jgi:hypothetical protein
MKTAGRSVAMLVIALLAFPSFAGNGNGIPPGINPFEYLLSLINGLQAQIIAIPGGGGGDCSTDLSGIRGTWTVANQATGTSGEVTFNSDGTYTIHSGTYNAGGSFLGKTSGRYSLLDGGAIAFKYAGSATVDRIAVVQCAQANKISHFVMGHTLDYETLNRVRVELGSQPDR